MERIKVENTSGLTDLIATMEVNTYYEMPDNFRYKWIKIESSEGYYSKEPYFSWAMEHNYKVSGCVGYIYPLNGNNMVTHFKTEKGAKSNLIKRFKKYAGFYN